MSRIRNARLRRIDQTFGARIRRLRISQAMTQQQLADKIGVKFQQVQKYETGANRVSISRACFIANALGVYLEDLVTDLGYTSFQPQTRRQKDILKLQKAASKLNQKNRGSLIAVAKALATMDKHKEKNNG